MRTRTAVVIWTLALVVAAGASALSLTSDHEGNPFAQIALSVPVGLAFIASGLIACSRRPENRTGLLMLLTGFAWFLGALSESDNSIVYTAGIVLGYLVFGFFAHLVLAFPSGRLETRARRIVAACAYVLMIGVHPAAMLVVDFRRERGCSACPPNEVLITEHEMLGDVLEVVMRAGSFTVAVAIIVILVRCWRAASPPLRRALGPVLLTSGGTLVILAVWVTAGSISPRIDHTLNWVSLGALLTVPLAFLFGLLRTRLARSALGQLLVELRDSLARGDLRDSLARALGDPTLEIAYALGDGVYVGVDGRRVDLPGDGDDRAATFVEREGVCIAALVHDPSLLDDPDLLEAAAAAAGLSLENERRLAALAESETRNRALLDAIPDLMFRISRDGVYLDVRGDERALVAPAEELIGKNVLDVLPRDVAERVGRSAHRALETGAVQSAEYELTIGGTRRSFEGRIVPSGEDEVLLIVRDFTDRKRAEEELARLHAELRARLEELKASRARIVEAGAIERRRLERNLHDGAQQRLVSLSLTLRLVEAKLRSDPDGAVELLQRGNEQLSLALEELRELARGIHPAVLTDRGLEPALHALTARAPLPVEVSSSLDDRLPGPVEAAAYYVVSEALANIAKYAQASSAKVHVARHDGRAVVEVADDGVGGADPARGSGLRGLADRVEALDGRLDVESPPGGGTTVRAEIPIG